MEKSTSHDPASERKPAASRVWVRVETAIFCITLAAMAWVAYDWLKQPYWDRRTDNVLLGIGMLILAIMSKSRVASFVTWIH